MTNQIHASTQLWLSTLYRVFLLFSLQFVTQKKIIVVLLRSLSRVWKPCAVFLCLMSLETRWSVAQTGLPGSFFIASPVPEAIHPHQHNPFRCWTTGLFLVWTPTNIRVDLICVSAGKKKTHILLLFYVFWAQEGFPRVCFWSRTHLVGQLHHCFCDTVINPSLSDEEQVQKVKYHESCSDNLLQTSTGTQGEAGDCIWTQR